MNVSTDLRRCIGSAKFGIEAHEAPVGDFPAQPSQKDGLGRMCKAHWTEYTRALRRASAKPKGAPASVVEVYRAKADKATVQSQAAARVATNRAARVAAAKPAKKPEPIRTRPARGRKTEGEQIVEEADAAIAREATNVAEPIVE